VAGVNRGALGALFWMVVRVGALVGVSDALGAARRRGQPDKLRMNADTVTFVKAFVDTGKPIAAICHAPWTTHPGPRPARPRGDPLSNIWIRPAQHRAKVLDQKVVIDALHHEPLIDRRAVARCRVPPCTADGKSGTQRTRLRPRPIFRPLRFVILAPANPRV
jgi:hypothetical protein